MQFAYSSESSHDTFERGNAHRIVPIEINTIGCRVNWPCIVVTKLVTLHNGSMYFLAICLARIPFRKSKIGFNFCLEDQNCCDSLFLVLLNFCEDESFHILEFWLGLLFRHWSCIITFLNLRIFNLISSLCMDVIEWMDGWNPWF